MINSTTIVLNKDLICDTIFYYFIFFGQTMAFHELLVGVTNAVK